MQGRFVYFFIALAIFLTAGSFVTGQSFEISSPDQSMSAGNGTVSFNATFSIEQVTGATEETKGFSFAFRHDPALLEVVGSNPFVPTVLGELAAVNDNDGPDFIQGEIFVDGFTIGVIYAFVDQTQVITFEVAKPMIEVDYSTLAGAVAGITDDVVTDIISAADLGTPPTATVVVIGAGVSADATSLPFSITFEAPPPVPDPIFIISAPDQSVVASGPNGGVASFVSNFSIEQDLSDPAALVEPTDAFQFGYQHDETLLQVDAVDEGAVVAVLGGGSGADFFGPMIYANGFTVGCSYDFQLQQTISFATPGEVVDVSYSSIPGALNGATGTQSTDVEESSNIGSPPLDPLVVVDQGTSIDAIALSFNVGLTPAPANVFTLRCTDQQASFSSVSGIGSFTNSITMTEDSDNTGYPNDTQGFSFGIGHDSNLLTVLDVHPGAILDALNGGSGPSFYNVGIFTDGCTVGCVYDFQNIAVAQFPTETELASADYETVAGTLAGTDAGDTIVTQLTPAEGLGPNPVTLVMVVNGQSNAMASEAGEITLVAAGGFDRGDCNDDGLFDIADGITLLNNLFLGGDVPCDDACDGNDDELKDIADPIYILAALFNNGPLPPDSGSCGPDPTEGTLGCDSFDSCV
ncbi:MAG: hypothetical protein HRU16_01520 [Planctomycetes bacterium]|nr:hypothetical protein [Planctomycetota bacterium]